MNWARGAVMLTVTLCWMGFGAGAKLGGPDFAGRYKAKSGRGCNGEVYKVSWDAEENQIDIDVLTSGKNTSIVVDTVPRTHYNYYRDKNQLSIQKVLGSDNPSVKVNGGGLIYVSQTTQVTFDKSGIGAETASQREEIGLSGDGQTLTDFLFQDGKTVRRCALTREVAVASAASRVGVCGR